MNKYDRQPKHLAIFIIHIVINEPSSTAAGHITVRIVAIIQRASATACNFAYGVCNTFIMISTHAGFKGYIATGSNNGTNSAVFNRL